MRSDRAANRAFQADLAEEALGHQPHQRQNRPPAREPDCPSGLRGCWFPGDRKFDPASGRMRMCCANCGKFEYVWAAERKALRGR
jgi:hypothetical protein